MSSLSPALPPRIYKYEPLSAQSLQNLKSQIIYFGSPREFNDGYDCALNPEVEVPSEKEAEAIRHELLRRDEVSGQIRRELEALPSAELALTLQRAVAGFVAQTSREFLDKHGVTCFSESVSNLLMWAHYAGKAQGFCLEFDALCEPFKSKLFPVSYQTAVPSIKVTADLVVGRRLLPLIHTLFCTKSADWAYEREWRAMHAEKGTRYCYPVECLTGVYFGPDSSGESQEIVCLILQGQNERVRFYQGQRSEKEFKVVFRPFTYTSYLAAKKAGILKT